MNKDIQLIKLYCDICQYYNTTLVLTAQRQSNNFCPKFTDEECITIYIWGIIQQKFNVKAIYEFIKDYYRDWFPNLPSYQAFNKRICYLNDTFRALAELFLVNIPDNCEIKTHLMDSMPIIVANSKRCNRAKSAFELCDVGYCASKGIYFYGTKLHVAAQSQYQALPIPRLICVTKASEHDLPVAKRVLEDVYNIDLYCDKAYQDSDWEADMEQNNGVKIYTSTKLKKGQEYLDSADKLFSKAVSAVRQPIESFFNWLQEKTNIQYASKVRSADGLNSFIFARLSSVLFDFKYNYI